MQKENLTKQATKIKQILKEFFNKNIKTVDINFQNRMKYVSQLEFKVKDLLGSVMNFVKISQGSVLLICLSYLELSMATETLGNTLFICYSDSLYEPLMLKVRENLKSNKDLADRNEAINQNLQRVVGVIVDTVR